MQKLLAAIIILTLTSTYCVGQTFKPRYGQGSSQRTGDSARTQNRSLELRVLVDDRSSLGTSHDWMQALAEVGADRVVAETSRARKPSFEEFDSGSTKLLTVVGIVKQGKLHLPGGKFTIRQVAAIRAHLQKLRDDGAEVTVAEKVAFGLTAKQLVALHDQLGLKITSPTAGQNAGKLASTLMKNSGYPISIDRTSQLVISSAQSTVDIELEGYSIGTGLAIALRQLGLVFEPVRPQGQKVKLVVRAADEKTKNWPVGWPVSESRKKAAPNLFVKVDVQAAETPILDLLGAIEGRIEIPLIYDVAKISERGVDLASTKVSFSRPGKKSSYDMVMDKVLNQCKPKLKSELKIDEAGKRFLWITTRN
ncbi:hypothetical protein [Mariniblastus fucicola]|uniref:Uncharacterized protein n=1 Tax=Mariniblastus fucicola TaxID=980251 RepID=A0A5B9PHA3_9BACT|nr:hypothetical protein [Mariniblastus fucicola]QEG23996.1 hypothetical protein MFFC18_39020 [Mariniblastus fucicola]